MYTFTSHDLNLVTDADLVPSWSLIDSQDFPKVSHLFHYCLIATHLEQ